MKKRVFIVHGWGEGPERGWLPWLQIELQKKGYEVIVPLMPDADNPDIHKWQDQLIKVVGVPDENTYFVGHSVGCQTILRYLATLLDIHVAEVICVAPWLTLKGLETEQEKQIARPWLDTPFDYNKVRNSTSRLVAFFSDNDPYVPFAENQELFQNKLGAEVIVEHNKGHFTTADGVTEMPGILKFFSNDGQG